jgi:circadian clock protein KaiC
MAHSNQIREFILTSHGAKLVDVAMGPDGIVTGSARVSQREKEAAGVFASQQASEAKRRSLTHKRTALEARVKALQAEFDAEAQAIEVELAQERLREQRAQTDRSRMAQLRTDAADLIKPVKEGGK